MKTTPPARLSVHCWWLLLTVLIAAAVIFWPMRGSGGENPMAAIMWIAGVGLVCLFAAALYGLLTARATARETPQIRDELFRATVECAPTAIVVADRGRPDRAGQFADGEALRLHPRRNCWASRSNCSCRTASAQGILGLRKGLHGRSRGAADGRGPRPVRPAQGRQRVPRRDRPESRRNRPGPVRPQRDRRHHRAEAGRERTAAAERNARSSAWPSGPANCERTLPATDPRQGGRRGRQPGQERLPGQHEPRDPHAAERRASA